VKKLVSKLQLPLIVSVVQADCSLLSLEYLYRVEDCIAILNRIIERWDSFHSCLGPDRIIDDELEEEIRLETIEDTFSFITFAELLAGFYRGIDKEIKKVASFLNIDSTALAPGPRIEDSPVIEALHTIRNKMVAHTAALDPNPKKDDSIPNNLAYLRWYVGHWESRQETRNRRLNTFSVGVQKGLSETEVSNHAIPPPFEDMVTEFKSHIAAWEKCIEDTGRKLEEHVRGGQSHGHIFVGYTSE